MNDVTRSTHPWLAHYDPEVPTSLEYEEIPLFELLDRTARTYPANRAVTFRNYTLDYQSLKDAAEAVAASFRARGLKPGERIAIMLPNCPQAIITYWGALKAGLTVVMTNPLYMEHELSHHLGDSGARAMVLLDLVWDKVAELAPRIPVEQFFVTGMQDALRFPLTLLYRLKSWREGKTPSIPYGRAGVEPWKRLLDTRDRYSHAAIDPKRDLALLQYTGGTTGLAKGVMLSHFNLTANIQQILAFLHGLTLGREVFLGVLPYFHIYGLCTCLNLPTALGATMLPFPRFSPTDLLAAISAHKPTVFPGAPSIYTALLRQKEVANHDFSSINILVSGSGPIPREVMERFKAMTRGVISEGYGLTEASPVTHLNPVRGRQKAGSIGLPFPDTEARIVDLETGTRDLPPGEAGELIVRGPQVMMGYLNQPEETAQTLREGWLHTGDVAVMDEEGYFAIVDRKKDLIISGGYNVYPREVEEVLYEHPLIEEAVVVGVPSATRGETVKAFVVPKAGASLDKTEIIGFCKHKLANYKVPRQVEIRTELPKTMVGKVLRRALRDEEQAKARKTAGRAAPE